MFREIVGRKPTRGSAADQEVRPAYVHEAEGLARELYEARCELRSAGRALHDQTGSLLSAAGLRLQLLRTDFPETADVVDQVLIALDEAMGRVRSLSQALNPSPAAHLGLRGALAQLVSGYSAASFEGTIRLTYRASAKPPPDAAVAIYDAVAVTIARAVKDRAATRIHVSASGARNIVLRVVSNGRWRWSRKAAAAEARRARPAGVIFTTERGTATLVSINYVSERAPRG